MNLCRIFRGKPSAFIRWLLDPYGADRRDDALYEADTRLLERMRERKARGVEIRMGPRPPLASECPIAACSDCAPDLPAWVRAPAREPDRSRHTWPWPNTPKATVGWLLETYPDAWYFDHTTNLEDVAICLQVARLRVVNGTVTS